MNKKNVVIIIIIIVLLIISNVIFLILYINKEIHCQDNLKFKYVAPRIAWKETDDFLKEREHFIVSYSGLKPSIQEIITNKNGDYGVYFEDLTTGSWLGINERDKYFPLSLVKLPLLVTVLKSIENDELKIDDKITIKKEFLDSKFGTLYTKGEGYNATVKELLIYLINESDNTAFHALINKTSVESFETTRVAMGLPQINGYEKISPKDYANMLRSLYLSTYLRRTFSELGLSIMTETGYNSQIPAGLPKNIKVAHKVGIDASLKYYHDCGIIYDENPYLLCVMSSNSTQEEADKVISNISKVIYNYKHNIKT
jgi:beta-lactamase class A